jgi:hypothetical protein
VRGTELLFLIRQRRNQKGKIKSNGTRIKSDLNGFTRINLAPETFLNIRENPPNPRHPRSIMNDVHLRINPFSEILLTY